MYIAGFKSFKEPFFPRKEVTTKCKLRVKVPLHAKTKNNAVQNCLVGHLEQPSVKAAETPFAMCGYHCVCRQLEERGYNKHDRAVGLKGISILSFTASMVDAGSIYGIF